MGRFSPEQRAEAVALANRIGPSPAARQLGISKGTMYRWFDPTFAERSREHSRRAKQRRVGTCERCGGETRYSGHGKPTGVARFCSRCGPVVGGETHKVWTRDALIGAAQRWYREHGAVPTTLDWWHARDGYPCFNPPLHEFGRWHLFLRAAGFQVEPYRQIKPGRKAA